MTSDLSTAASLGEWVRAEMASGRHVADHTTRVITRETDRWFKNDLNSTQILALCEDPTDTGDPRWTALIEGVVARRLHEAGLRAPTWTRRTRLDDVWGPYEHLARDNDAWALMIFRTPSELLDKGVVLGRDDLDLL